MSKIVIIAPHDADVDDAVKLLKSAGNDVDVEEPTGKALLHIVLGLMGPNAYGFGDDYAIAPAGGAGGGSDMDDDKPAKADKKDKPVAATKSTKDKDTTNDDDKNADDGDSDTDAAAATTDDADFNFEALATTVDGEKVLVERVKAPTSTLLVEDLNVGTKTTYKLDESIFAFYPPDLASLIQRVDVKVEGRPALQYEIAIGRAEDGKAKLLVGDDLAEAYQTPENEAQVAELKKQIKMLMADKTKDNTTAIAKLQGKINKIDPDQAKVK